MEYKTSVFYAGGGSTYTFPFEYLQKSFVKVRYQKPDGAFQNLEFGKDYTVEENRVNLTAASDSTYKVNIYRSTPTDRMVKYVDASILKAHDMNVNELQTLHIMEEQTDYLTAYALFRGDNANVWEANTLRIINLATPLEPTDAVNKAYVDEYGVTWNQNVAQMKKQLQDQNTNITNQLDTQNRNITKQLADQQTLFNQQLSDQDTSFNARIAEHDTELLNKVNTNNQKYKTELQTYNDGVVKQIHDDAGASAALAKKWAQGAGSPDNESDSVSPTGKTQSAKSWAGVAESQAQASATAAAEAKKSQNAASTSEQSTKGYMDAAGNSASAALRSQEASASSESKAKESANQCADSVATCTTRVTEANQAKESASASANTATTKATESGNSASLAKKWAVSAESPDGAVGSKSAKTWAEEAKASEQKATTSANNAKASENNAKTSEGNAKASETASANSASASAKSATAAKGSEDKAKTSEVNAKASEVAAAESAKQAAAGQINADWNETNANSKAFIKNKPEVLKYKKGDDQEVLEWESNCVQSVSEARATDHPDAYNYGLQVTLGKIEPGQGAGAKLYFPHNDGLYLKNIFSGSNDSGWLRMLDTKNFPLYALPRGGTAVRATSDAAGNNIQTTYAKKSDLAASVTTNTLTATDAIFTGETSVPTANEGNSSNTIASTEFVAKSLAKLVDSAPESLNTLNELAKALGNDPDFATTVINELGKKMNSVEAESTFAKKEDAGGLSGTVMAFSGTFDNGYPIDKKTGLADKKWHLCDGTNGTPDLRNRFIYGGDGTNNGATGGEASHKLTEAELPVFTPSIRTSRDEDRPKSNSLWHRDRDSVAAGSDAPRMSSAPLASIGGDQPHNNMPPYYVLAYIMKL